MRILILLAFLAASIWLGLVINHHPGYVLLVAQPLMVQMPLWFAALAVVLAFGLFYILIDSMDRLQFWWFRVKNWLRLRREHQSYNKTQNGLALLIEGRFAKAERLLIKGADQGEPLMNYLGAARAAQAQQAIERRNLYLIKAQKIAPHAELAIGLTQAELEIEQKQFKQAEVALEKLRAISRRHPAVLKLLEKVYVHLGEWDKLLLILPDMRKAKVLTQEQIDLFEKNIICEKLKAAGAKDRAELQRTWDQLSRSQRKNTDIVTAYVEQLVTFGDQAQAEDFIRYVLKYQYAPALVKIYSQFHFENINRQLVIAGAWLKMYGAQPAILLFLGKACASIQLWGKAKDYFEQCLELEPNPEAALEYGKLLLKLGDNEAAMREYQEVLKSLQ